MASKLKLTELLYPTSTTPAITINADDTVTFGAPTTTITNLSATSITDSGNLTFTGTGNRIRGDFSNATAASRVAFQTSTTNGGTRISAIANGSGTFSQLALYGGSDLANSSILQLTQFATECSFNSTNSGTGLVSPIAFAIGGSEAMRITTNRDVGIGTISNLASSKLDVRGRIRTGSGNSSGDAEVIWSNYASATTAWNISVRQDVGGANNNLKFLRFDSSGAYQGVVMQLDNSANLLFAASSSNAIGIPSLEVGGNNGDALITVRRNTTAAAGQVIFYNPNGAVGSILTTGSATSYNTSSDYRLKENVAPMTGALQTVAQLKPCTYKWKADGSNGQGFIAHELQAVVPDCVTGTKDAVDAEGKPQYQGVDTSFLVATLVAAIQELKAEIDLLKGN